MGLICFPAALPWGFKADPQEHLEVKCFAKGHLSDSFFFMKGKDLSVGRQLAQTLPAAKPKLDDEVHQL